MKQNKVLTAEEKFTKQADYLRSLFQRGTIGSDTFNRKYAKLWADYVGGAL